MTHTSAQYKQIQDALLTAFNRAELRRMVSIQLEVELAQVAGGETDTDLVETLVKWAERQNRVLDLINGALAANPGNEQLIALRQEAQGWHLESPDEGEPPYQGLQYFDVEDADRFFGRETLTANLLGYLRDHRFLAIIGASGSGKSSLVRAGLIPALNSGGLVSGDSPSPLGSEHWPVHIITPMAHPLQQIAASLTRETESVTAQATLMDDLASDPRSLQLYATRLVNAASSRRLLLVVDQFEELFTLCRDPVERRQFIDNLLTAAVIDGVTTVIITLRADFYHRCADYPMLRNVLEQHQRYIGAMDQDELQRAIEEPAKKDGWTLEPGLVDLLIYDVAEEPGALPLLSHALLETWKRRRGRTLTLAGYAGSGRVQGAIAQTAEYVYNQQLSAEQRPVARNIFVRLTELGEGVQDTRRRAALGELLPQSPDEATSVTDVLQALADARLIITDQDEVEIAHEALIREWQTLREWLQDDREGLRIHRRVSEAAQEWESHRRDASYLHLGTRLELAREWANEHADNLNSLESDFLAASQRAVEEAAEANEASRQRELETARRLAEEAEARQQAEKERAREAEARSLESEQARRRLRRRAWILAVLTLLAVAAAGLAFDRQNRFSQRNRQLDTANSTLADQNRRLDSVNQTLNHQNELLEEERIRNLDLARVSVAGEQMLTDPTTAALVLTEIGDPDIAPLARRRLGEVLRLPLVYAELHHDSALSNLWFSPDGSVIVTVTNDDAVQVWEVESGQPLTEPLAHDLSTSTFDGSLFAFTDRSAITAAISPDGVTMLTTGGNTARLWDIERGEHRHAEPWEHDSTVTLATFSPDGQYVLSAAGNMAWLWDVETGELHHQPWEHSDRITTAAFSPDGELVAIGSDDGKAQLWDVATGEERFAVPLEHDDGRGVLNVLFSPDGARLLTGDDRSGRIWNVETGEEETSFEASATRTWFSPKQRLLAVAQPDSVSVRQTFSRGEQFDPLPHPRIGGIEARFSSDGNTLWTVLRHQSFRYQDPVTDNIVRAWDMGNGDPIAARPLLHDGEISVAAFSPDGRFLATISATRSGGGRGEVLIPETFVRVWLLETEGERFSRHFPGDVAAFSPDGDQVVTADNGTISLWGLETGRKTTLEPWLGEKRVRSLAFTADGNRIVGGSGNEVQVWDAATGHTTLQLDQPLISLSADGRILITKSADDTIQVWNIQTGYPHFAEAPQSCNYAVPPAVSADGTLLASVCDEAVELWDIESGQERFEEAWTHDGYVRSIAFSPDGTRVISASDDYTARVWDVDTGREVLRLQHEAGLYGVQDVSYSPNGTQILTVNSPGTVHVWDAGSGDELFWLDPGSSTVTAGYSAAKYSGDGRFIVTVLEAFNSDSLMQVWDAETSAMLYGASIGYPVSADSSVGIYPEFIITWSARIWQMETGEELFAEALRHPSPPSRRGSSDDIRSASISPDGRHLLTTVEGETRVWTLSGESLQEAVRASTIMCLSPNFRQWVLGESPEEARAAHEVCERDHGRV